MAISRSKKKGKKKSPIQGFNIDKVPFVPAFDLLEQKKNDLSEEEVAAVALTLFCALDSEEKSNNLWATTARLEAVMQRL